MRWRRPNHLAHPIRIHNIAATFAHVMPSREQIGGIGGTFHTHKLFSLKPGEKINNGGYNLRYFQFIRGNKMWDCSCFVSRDWPFRKENLSANDRKYVSAVEFMVPLFTNQHGNLTFLAVCIPASNIGIPV